MISYYKTFNARPNTNLAEKEALNMLMAKIILEHHSSKHNKSELDSSRAIYALLPAALQCKIAAIVPEVAEKSTSIMQHSTSFSDSRNRVRDIRVVGKLEDRLLHQDTIMKLLGYMRENNITKTDIIKITVERNTLIISTAPNQEIWDKIRSELFIKKLGAEIDDIDGVYDFSVKNPNALHFASAPGLK